MSGPSTPGHSKVAQVNWNVSKRLRDRLPQRARRNAAIWLPRLTEDHFARFQIATGQARLNTTRPDPVVPGILHVFESVEIPVANLEEMKALLMATAEIELRHPTIRLVDFIISPHPTDPSQQTVSLNLEALDRQ